MHVSSSTQHSTSLCKYLERTLYCHKCHKEKVKTLNFTYFLFVAGLFLAIKVICFLLKLWTIVLSSGNTIANINEFLTF